MTYRVLADPTGMACTIVACDAAHHYTITTTYLADPARDAVLMRMRFRGPGGDQLYVRLDPLAGGTGGGGSQNAGGNTATLASVDGGPVPVASNTNTTTDAVNRNYAVPTYMALESSAGFSTASVGYAGTASDGLTMLDSSHELTSLRLGARRPRHADRGRPAGARPQRRARARLRHDPAQALRVAGASVAPAFRPRAGAATSGSGSATTPVCGGRPRASAAPRSTSTTSRSTSSRPARTRRSRARSLPGWPRRGDSRFRPATSPTASRRTSAPTARCSPAICTRRSPGCSSPATCRPPATRPCSCSTASSRPTARCRATR